MPDTLTIRERVAIGTGWLFLLGLLATVGGALMWLFGGVPGWVAVAGLALSVLMAVLHETLETDRLLAHQEAEATRVDLEYSSPYLTHLQRRPEEEVLAQVRAKTRLGAAWMKRDGVLVVTNYRLHWAGRSVKDDPIPTDIFLHHLMPGDASAWMGEGQLSIAVPLETPDLHPHFTTYGLGVDFFLNNQETAEAVAEIISSAMEIATDRAREGGWRNKWLPPGWNTSDEGWTP